MEKIKKTIPNIDEFKQHLKGLVGEMEYSHSSLTQKRLELWLFNKVHLGNGQVTPGYFDQRLYNLCQRIYPGSDVGLLTYHGQERGGSCGLIASHRDHGYAKPMAVSLNIGRAEFVVDDKTYLLEDGDINQFNCKFSHSVPRILSEERFSLVLWQLNGAKGFTSQMEQAIKW
ncbi:hypothetical protein [Microcoleus sp. B3-D7]|uniref:hypothetical protein n=1 Tax=Microcoleus sp. B3-D7 TaxID=2818659 RepID=UPI002FD0F15A